MGPPSNNRAAFDYCTIYHIYTTLYTSSRISRIFLVCPQCVFGTDRNRTERLFDIFAGQTKDNTYVTFREIIQTYTSLRISDSSVEYNPAGYPAAFAVSDCCTLCKTHVECSFAHNIFN